MRFCDGVEPDSAHHFTSYQGKAITLPESCNYEHGRPVIDALDKGDDAGFPVLLHCPCPSFEGWQAKFSLYGSFSDYCLDDERYLNMLQFMLQS